MTFPVFASGDVLNASDMNGVGLWLVKTQAVGSGVASVTVTGHLAPTTTTIALFTPAEHRQPQHH